MRLDRTDLCIARLDEGVEYLASLKLWQDDPTDSGQTQRLRNSLQIYASSLVKLTRSDLKTPVKVILSHLPPTWRWFAGSAGTYAISELWKHNHGAAATLGALAAISNAGYAIYQGFRDQNRKIYLSIDGARYYGNAELKIFVPSSGPKHL